MTPDPAVNGNVGSAGSVHNGAERMTATAPWGSSRPRQCEQRATNVQAAQSHSVLK